MRHEHSDEPISVRFIADWEQRIVKQKQLIEQLKSDGRQTAKAEILLRQQQQTLASLRNHADIMHDLMSPSGYEKS